LNNKGCLKIADFGLARKFTQDTRKSHNVVTFWYRAPELLLGTKDYDDKIDIWSIGCIFAEFLTGHILFKGKKIKDQLQMIYEKLGNPLKHWKKVNQTTLWKEMKPTRKYEPSLKHFLLKYNSRVDEATIDLMIQLLHYDPKKRISAEDALNHEYFFKHPLPCSKESIRRFRGEFHELNSKSKQKYKISENMVMGDYQKIKSMDFLREMYQNYQSQKNKQKKEIKYNQKQQNSIVSNEPQFSSDEESKRKIEPNYLTKRNRMQYFNSNDQEEDLPSGLGEAFFSDEDQNAIHDKIPSNKSEDEENNGKDDQEDPHDYILGLGKPHDSKVKKKSTKTQKIRDLDFDWI
jgi:serine/threonine protein kinase